MCALRFKGEIPSNRTQKDMSKAYDLCLERTLARAGEYFIYMYNLYEYIKYV